MSAAPFPPGALPPDLMDLITGGGAQGAAGGVTDPVRTLIGQILGGQRRKQPNAQTDDPFALGNVLGRADPQVFGPGGRGGPGGFIFTGGTPHKRSNAAGVAEALTALTALIRNVRP